MPASQSSDDITSWHPVGIDAEMVRFIVYYLTGAINKLIIHVRSMHRTLYDKLTNRERVPLEEGGWVL